MTVARHEWKHIAEMALDLDPSLPLVPCLPDEINQVVLNLIVNAAHAIADVVDAHGMGKGVYHDQDPPGEGLDRPQHHRYRERDSGSDPGQGLRSILYHQGSGQRHRPGARHCL